MQKRWNFAFQHLLLRKNKIESQYTCVCQQEKYVITCDVVVAGFVQNAREELEADDGVDDDHEDDQERDVEQGDHRHED